MKHKLTLAFITLLASGSAFAHGQHCHVKDASGASVDDKTLTTKSACTAKGGEWTHHELHCHTKDADGKLVDHTEIKSRYKCEKANGVWEDHDPTAASPAPEAK